MESKFACGEAIGPSPSPTASASGSPAPSPLPPSPSPPPLPTGAKRTAYTPAQLAGYVPYFNQDFLGASGPEPSLAPLAAGLGVAYGKTSNEDGSSYTVDHTAAIFLVDPAGRLAAVFGTPHSAATIASDFRYVLETSG